MRIAMLAPIAWRTPPRHYGPWESVVSLLTEGLVARGFEVTLFATGDSETGGELHAVCAQGYEEDRGMIAKVWECLHISEVFEHAHEFDLIHNHFDFLPLTYAGLVSTPVVRPTGPQSWTISKPSTTASIWRSLISSPARTAICCFSDASIPTRAQRKPSRLPAPAASG